LAVVSSIRTRAKEPDQTCAEAVDLARRLRPDVILMDIRMPGLDGLEATRQIAADPELAGVHVVILTTFGLDEYLFDALRFGASGFLVKDTEPADLATAVRVVAQGDSLISPSMTRRLVAEFARRAKEPHPAAELDGITLAILGLHNCAGSTVLHIHASGPMADVSYAPEELYYWPVIWIRDSGGRWHTTRTRGRSGMNGEVALRLEVIPPLSRATAWIEVHAAGRSIQSRTPSSVSSRSRRATSISSDHRAGPAPRRARSSTAAPSTACRLITSSSLFKTTTR